MPTFNYPPIGLRAPGLESKGAGYVTYSAVVRFTRERLGTVPDRLEDVAIEQLRAALDLDPLPRMLVLADIRDDDESLVGAVVVTCEPGGFTDNDGPGDLGRFVTEDVRLLIRSDNDRGAVCANYAILWACVDALLAAQCALPDLPDSGMVD